MRGVNDVTGVINEENISWKMTTTMIYYQAKVESKHALSTLKEEILGEYIGVIWKMFLIALHFLSEN